MNSFPRVCIMIPTYNQASFIIKAVESALAQDYPGVEIVIADDCSTDNTGEIIQPYLIHEKIKYIKNSLNIGRVANYRKCLYEYTNADWVINLDGDDYYTNNHFISEAMEAIETLGITGVLFYQGVNYLKNEQDEKLLEPKIESAEICITAKEYFLGYFERDSFSHMSTLYHRQSALESDFYSWDIISSDIFSFLSLCLKSPDKKVIVSKLISGVWLQHENNISQSKQFKLHKINAGLFLTLCRQALAKGFARWKCYKWLIKGWYFYSRSYIFKLARFLN